MYQSIKNKGVFSKDNFLSLMLFEESLDELEIFVKMEPLRELCFDFTTELISKVNCYKFNDDEGVFRIAEALNSNFWRNSNSKNMTKEDKKYEHELINSKMDNKNNKNNDFNKELNIVNDEKINNILDEEQNIVNNSGNNLINEKLESKIPYNELLDNDFELINKLSELKEK